MSAERKALLKSMSAMRDVLAPGWSSARVARLREAIAEGEDVLNASAHTGPFGTEPHPKIATRCPGCGAESLFIGNGGHLTCAVLRCSQPSVEAAMEELRAALEDALCTLIAIAAQPATAGRLWAENPTLGATLARVRLALKQAEPADPLKRMS